LRKPEQQKRQPKKRELLVITASNRDVYLPKLKRAAATALYAGSPYHRVTGSPMGGVPAGRRWPHASKCPPIWDERSATQALREAIRAGRVSADWDEDSNFPRLVWHLDGETLYEARLSNKELGEYHAYPLEDRREWPANI
jgi:hypothetical protein